VVELEGESFGGRMLSYSSWRIGGGANGFFPEQAP